MAEQEASEEPGRAGASGEVRTRSDYCVFTRGEGTFALSTHVAREVLEARPFTPVPRGPDDLVGAFNLRGEVLPLVRLDRFLGAPERSLERSDAFLVLCHGDLALAAIVDRVVAIRHIAPWEIQRPDPGARAQNPLVRGTTVKEGQTALVLDAERLLAEVTAHVASGFRCRPDPGLQGEPAHESPEAGEADDDAPRPAASADGR